jgi:hypothetical protein
MPFFTTRLVSILFLLIIKLKYLLQSSLHASLEHPLPVLRAESLFLSSVRAGWMPLAQQNNENDYEHNQKNNKNCPPTWQYRNNP